MREIGYVRRKRQTHDDEARMRRKLGMEAEFVLAGKKRASKFFRKVMQARRMVRA